MNFRLKVRAAAVALGVAAAMAAVAPAHALVVGSANDGSGSIPFSSTTGGYYYQQVYSAASFASAIDISQLSFYNSINPGGTARGGTFQIYLSTTSAAVPTFDTTTGVDYPWFDASFTQVFDGEIPAVAEGQLDFDLSTAFHYDPSAGNLLLTVRELTFAGGTGDLYLDLYKNDGVTNSRFYSYPYEWNQGLVTGFNEGVSPVPEPGTYALMLAGLGIIGAVARRRVGRQ